MRMWDSNPLDPVFTHKLPFERDAFTYIQILASPLVGGIIGGTANLVTRGKGQTLDLEPYLNSFDPDYPELTVSGNLKNLEDGIFVQSLIILWAAFAQVDLRSFFGVDHKA